MEFFEQNNSPDAAPSAPIPPSTNPDSPSTQSLKHLSIDAASGAILPTSSQTQSPKASQSQHKEDTAPPPRSPMKKSSSSSLVTEAKRPDLAKKTSMTSIQSGGIVTPPRRVSTRRFSAAYGTNGNSNGNSNATSNGMAGKSPLSGMDEHEETFIPPPTVTSVAKEYFTRELGVHEAEDRQSETIVILHDSCYGHRFSRPRTSRAALSTIVERPERIHASVLGLSVAYVRLGDRHAEGKHGPHPKKEVSQLPSIPFRIRRTTRKLALSSPAVTNVHGIKWMEELKTMCDSAESKLAMNGKELARPETSRSPDQGAPQKLHEGDLYLCSESLNAMEGALGAVCEGVDAVFNGTTSRVGPSRAFVAIRPPGHHCSAGYPSGFCWLNNVHVGINHAALAHGLTHAAMIDFDLHHGDGSQAIAWEHNARATNLPKNAAPWKKTSIGYFSLHDINSYPCEMGDEEKIKNASLCIENAHGQNIWNVHLQPWKTDAEFWHLYETKYTVLLEKTRNFLRAQNQRLVAIPNGPRPKAAIFLSAGFDASEWESAGMQRHKVNVPTDFYARLTQDVVKLSMEPGLAVEGRVISVLEGGYSDRALSSGVLGHLSGLAGSDPLPAKLEDAVVGLAHEMARKVNVHDFYNRKDAAQGSSFDPGWWAVDQLELLDAVVHPVAPLPEARKPRDLTPMSYSSPTQSFSAKIIGTLKSRHSSSNFPLSAASQYTSSRSPTPPPPEVNWAVAAHELSKLLIPNDRQTMSCRLEDLSAEATRVRRDRQSLLTHPSQVADETTVAPAATARSGLRDRKAAKPPNATKQVDENVRPAAVKSNRRQTVAGSTIIPTEQPRAPSEQAILASIEVDSTLPIAGAASSARPEPAYSRPTKASSRRMSSASEAGSVSTKPATSASLSNGSRAPSISRTFSARPPSSQSIRPESAMSSRQPSLPPLPMPIVVKKTRPVGVTSKSTAGKVARTSKKGQASAATEDGASIRDGASSQSTMLDSSQIRTVITSDPDVDSLTSGLKKIRINLTTKAQREAREKSRASPLASAGLGISKDQGNPIIGSSSNHIQTTLPSIMTTESAFPDLIDLNGHTPRPLTPSNLDANSSLKSPTPVTPLPATSPAAYSTMDFNILPAAPTPPQRTTNPFPPAMSSAYGSQSSNVFIPYQPEGPSIQTKSHQAPLQWLPPNTGTPQKTNSGGMERKDLPVWSATGSIPFAATKHHMPFATQQRNGENEGAVKNEGTGGDSLWEVPETPKK